MSAGARWAVPARRALLVVAFALSGVAVASVRALHVGQRAMDRADAAFDRGELGESIREARRAASAKVPGASHVDAAYARLEVIARGAEAVGKKDVAVMAWDAMRGAALEAQSPWSEPRPELERANANLARLRAASVAGERSAGQNVSRERDLLRSLERPIRPSGGRTALVALGSFAAVVGLAWAALAGISPGGQVLGRKLAAGAVVAAIGFSCWVIALYAA